MATQKTKTSAKEMKVISFNLDDFVQGGLPTDFDGVAEKFRLVPWNYGGKRDEYSPAIRVDIVPDEDSGHDPFSAYLSVGGSLKHFVPSMDGFEPAGGSVDDYIQLADGDADTDPDNPEQYEGIYFLTIQGEGTLSKGSNFYQFLEALRDCGVPAEFIGADLSKMDGIYGHWNRVPQRKRDGLAGDDSGRSREILVLTEYKGKKGGGKTVAGKSKSTSTKSSANGSDNSTSADSDLEERLADVISSALSTEEAQAKLNDDGELPKKQIPPLILASIKSWPNSEKSAAVAMSTKPEFLGADGRPWIYNEDRGTVTPIG